MADDFKACGVDGCNGNAHWKAHGSRGFCGPHYTRLLRHGDPLGGRHSPGTCIQWLEDNVSHNSAECLYWPFADGGHGYGAVQFHGRMTTASRAMCVLAHGEPPLAEMEAAHNCGRGHLGCVNPQHLRWATRAENMADKIRHGTNQIGSSNAYAKLCEADIVEIRASPHSSRILAIRFGVDAAHIRLIRRGKIWKHVA